LVAFSITNDATYLATTATKTITLTLAVGDIVVIQAIGPASASPVATQPSGTGLTWTTRASLGAAGTVARNICFTATATVAGSIVITVTRPIGSAAWQAYAWQYRNASGIGAVGAPTVGTTSNLVTFTTLADNSAIAVGSSDWNASDGTTRTRRPVNGNAGTEDAYFFASGNYTTYAQHYADSGIAGSITAGYSAPASQQSAIIGVEVQGVDDGLGSSIELRAAGTPTPTATAVTAINPAVPAAATTGDLSVLSVTLKPYTATITTPSGWTKIGEATNGTTASGADVGSTKVAVFVQESATAGAIGALTQSGADSMIAVINTYEKDAGKTWDYSVFTTGSDTTNGANFSATGAAGLSMAAGDMVVATAAINGDVGTVTAQDIGGMAGITDFVASRTSAVTTTGNDSRILVLDAFAYSGTSSAAPTLTYTNASSGSGTVLWVRLRQVSSGLTGGGSLATTATLTGSGNVATGNGGTLAATATLTGSGSVVTATPLDRWNTAVAARATAAAKWLFIGDSISEGQGATTKPRRWADLLLAGMRSTYTTPGVAGGAGYVPSFYVVGPPDSPWNSYSSFTGSPTQSNVNGSLGYRTAFFTAAGSLTYNLTGTSVDLWWTGGGGTFSYQVDGGSQINVNTAGTYHTDYRTTVSLGSAGAHTVVIRWVSGSIGFSGFTVYNGDETTGIRQYDAARSGAKSADMLIEGGELVKAIQTIAPDLVIIELGGNDALQSVTAATFGANLQTIVSGILGSVSPVPSVLLVGIYTPASTVVPPGTVWADYLTQMSNIAASDPTRVAFLNLSLVMPTTDTTGTGLYSTDGLHPNNTGHRVIAGRVASAIGFGLPSLGEGTLAVTAGLTGSGVVGAGGGGALAGTAGLTGAGLVNRSAGGTLAVTATLTGSAVVARSGGGSLATTATLTGSGAVAASGGGSLAVTATLTGSGVVVAMATGVASGSWWLGAILPDAGFYPDSGIYPDGATAIGMSPPVGGGSLAVLATLTGAGSVVAAGGGGGSLTVTATLTGAGSVATGNGGTLAVIASRTGAGQVGVSGGGSLAVTAGLTGAGQVATTAGGSLPATVTLIGAGSAGVSGGGSLAVTATLTGSGTVVSGTSGGGNLAVTASLTGSGLVARSGGGTLAVTATLSGAGSAGLTGGGGLAVSAGFTGAGAVGKAAGGSLPVAAGLTGAGQVARTAGGDLAVTVTLSGAGTVFKSGSASGTVTWSGTAQAVTAPQGAATGTVTWAGTAVGTTIQSGTATGSVIWAGTANGGAEADGTATGTVTWAGTATGSSPVAGTATGAFTFTGTATGAITPAGTASGTLIWSGIAAGAMAAQGAATGAVLWEGEAVGVDPQTGYIPRIITIGTGRNHGPSSGQGHRMGPGVGAGARSGAPTVGAGRSEAGG
jgi:lysophospholipase L1-like esterase